MKTSFEKEINRYHTNCFKYDHSYDSYGEKGIIPVSVADMDFQAPQAVVEALKKVSEHGIYGYTSLNDDYFQVISHWMKSQYNWNVPKDHIVFCSRIVQAVSIIVQNFTNKNDKILFMTPGYSPLRNAIASNNREALDFPLELCNGHYHINFDHLRMRLDSNVKMLILVNPHNPTGRVWTKEELTQLAEICIQKDIMIISDEIHADFIRKGYDYTPIASLSEQIANKCIVCTSPAKTFNFPGIHVSHIIIHNKDWRNKFIDSIHKTGVHEPNNFVIPAVEAALTLGKPWLRELLEYIEGNYQYVKEQIETYMPHLQVIESQGTYLMWIDCRGTNMTSEDIWDWMVHHAKVGIYKGTNFGEAGEGFIRMNIACPRITLEKVMMRLKETYPLR